MERKVNTFKNSKSSVIWASRKDKERVENYLAATYGGSVSEFLRRLALERVCAWEEHQARLQKEISA